MKLACSEGMNKVVVVVVGIVHGQIPTFLKSFTAKGESW